MRLDITTGELEPQAAAMFEYADAIVLLWFVIMMCALAFGLINTLITAVPSASRVGHAACVGMRAGAVLMQVVIESLLIVASGLVCGILVGLGLIGYFADGIDLSRWAAGVELAGLRSVLVPRLMAVDVAVVGALSLLLGLSASAYPAWRAVRISPLDALRR
jgi:ABC-type lipoprotein release transport system permease subunit